VPEEEGVEEDVDGGFFVRQPPAQETRALKTLSRERSKTRQLAAQSDEDEIKTCNQYIFPVEVTDRQ
jgi:hypothetical protein